MTTSNTPSHCLPKHHLKVSFRQACARARFPLALAGAGLSAASGIPTFRGSGPASLWRRHDPLSLATPEAFCSNPSRVWQFYHWRRELCLRAEPNAAHRIIAWLSTSQGEQMVFPTATRESPQRQRFSLLTQNVDGLSKRANAAHEKQTGSTPFDPIEMHGSLFRTRCLTCKQTSDNFTSPIAPALKGTEDLSKSIRELPLAALPHCSRPSCQQSTYTGGDGASDGSHGLLRPAVVWFGESIPLLDSIETLVEQCDLLLVLGTSSTVYPAAGFANRVKRNGGKVAVFNIEAAGAGEADWDFEGRVEETLPWVMSEVGAANEAT